MRADGEIIEVPAVIVLKDGHPYAWTIGEQGRYSMELPIGDYTVYASAKGHGRGTAQIATIRRGETEKLDFKDVEPPGTVYFQVSDAQGGKALDARISIRSGPSPLIEYFGRSTLFTGLETIGEVTSIIAPGDYEFEVSAGGGFFSRPQLIRQTIAPGQKQEFDLEIATLAEPQAQGWYSADLHHHSDVLDGSTPAEFVLISQLAARLDITFLSDHDSVVSNAKTLELSARRGVLFMAGTELSPS